MVVCECQVFVDLRACEGARQGDRYVENQTNKESETSIGRMRAPARICARQMERGTVNNKLNTRWHSDT